MTPVHHGLQPDSNVVSVSSTAKGNEVTYIMCTAVSQPIRTMQCRLAARTAKEMKLNNVHSCMVCVYEYMPEQMPQSETATADAGLLQAVQTLSLLLCTPYMKCRVHCVHCIQIYTYLLPTCMLVSINKQSIGNFAYASTSDTASLYLCL